MKAPSDKDLDAIRRFEFERLEAELHAALAVCEAAERYVDATAVRTPHTVSYEIRCRAAVIDALRNLDAVRGGGA